MIVTLIIGIDPGKSGTAVFLSSSGRVDEIARFKDGFGYFIEALRNLDLSQNIFVFLEKVHAMPGQGVVSMFTFGEKVGVVKGALAAFKISYIEVAPQIWQRELGLYIPNLTYVERKRRLKEKAQELFPDTKVTADVADALLIAEYGRRQINGT